MASFEVEMSVRTYELDMLGHVNNAVYVSWMEQSRLAALEAWGYPVRALATDWLSNIVRIEVDFRRAAHYGDRLAVTTSLESIGRTSFTLRHEVLALPARDVVASGRAVLVWLDGEGRPVPVPTELAERLEPGVDEATEGA